MIKSRLRRVVKEIEADPKAFDMGTWHCGTHACFAGRAVVVAAHEKGKRLRGYDYKGDYPLALATAPSKCRIGDGPIEFWDEAACRYLGLTDDEGKRLFDTSLWPWEHKDAYYAARHEEDRHGMVAALKARVEHFISSGE